MKQFADDELIDAQQVQAKPVTSPTTHMAVLPASTPALAHSSAATTMTDIDDVPPPPERRSSGPVASPQPQYQWASDDDLPPGPPAYPRQQPQADTFGEEVGWGDEVTMRTGDGLERIRPEKGSNKAVRFALLPFLKPRRARIHWVPVGNSKGARICLAQGETSAWCCTKLREEGRYRVVALGLCYTNANPKNGGYAKPPDGSIPPITWSIGYLDLSPSNYGAISQLPEDDASPYDYDYSMSMANNRYEFRIKSKALWKAIPGVYKAVEEAARRYVADGGAKLGRKLGKTLSLVEWKALLSGTPSASEPSMDDMGEL
jgi:hypothetical protein